MSIPGAKDPNKNSGMTVSFRPQNDAKKASNCTDMHVKFQKISQGIAHGPHDKGVPQTPPFGSPLGAPAPPTKNWIDVTVCNEFKVTGPEHRQKPNLTHVVEGLISMFMRLLEYETDRYDN